MDNEEEIERTDILFQMAKEGKLTSVSHTGRSKEQVAKDLAKHFKVLEVTKDEDPDATACEMCGTSETQQTGAWTDKGNWLCNNCCHTLLEEMDDEFQN